MPTARSYALTCHGACKQGDPAVHHVDDLPSGCTVDVRLPSIGQFIEYGLIPNPLLDIAVKIEWEELKHAEMTAEQRHQYLQLMDVVVAGMCEPALSEEFVRGFSNVGTDEAPEWKPLRPAMPKEDRDWLWGIALRRVPVGGAKNALMSVLEKFRLGPDGGELVGNGTAAKSESGAGTRHR